MWWLIFPALFVIFIAVILIRGVAFKPKAQPKLLDGEEVFDKERATENLRTLVSFKTISYRDSSLEDDAEFEKLIASLPTLYPNVFAKCDFKQLPDRALLFKWGGKSAGEVAVMMAHYDVVPVNEDAWDMPAFEAIVKDGCIWGRGTLDTKVTFNGVLSAADHLIAEGFTPENAK